MRRFAGGDLVFATHNSGKLAEIAALLAPYPIRLSSNADHGLPEPDETADDFAGNALIKAQSAMRGTGLPALADDSGIEIEALGGAPGVKTADWALSGTGRDFNLAMTRVWRELEAVAAPEPRRARFCCTLALVWPDEHAEIFAGEMSGQIVWPMRGAQGHGFDPIFQPDGYALTFAEMDPALKNRISHRAVAFRKLVAGCLG